MNFALKNIQKYCEDHTTMVDPVRQELDRVTHLKTLASQMLAGHYQGKFLEFISYMIRPRYVLEIGTFTGYSALCWAKGLQPGGKVITLESNYELEYLIKEYIAKAGMEDRIELIIGDALETIKKLDITFDLVFIDAGKIDYPNYFDLVLPMVRKDGFIIADNVLWDGKVLLKDKDEETSALHRYSEKVHNDPRVENIMLPIRDGILLTRKI